MNVYVPKNRVTSRCSGQHCYIFESFICNVATFLRVVFVTSRWGQCLEPNVTTFSRVVFVPSR